MTNDKKKSPSGKDLLMEARCRLFINEAWYGAIAHRFNYIRDPSVKTIGVAVMNNGGINCYYNPDFLEQFKITEIMGILIHEIQHILLQHCTRCTSTDFINKQLFNIAADWVINGNRERPRIKNLPQIGVFLPIDNSNKVTDPQWLSSATSIAEAGLSSSSITEEWYQWLLKNIKRNKIIVSKFGHIESVVLPDGTKIEIVHIDNHQIWEKSTANNDQCRQIAKDLVRSASLAGNAPSDMIEVIKELDKPKCDWAMMLRSYAGRVSGGFKRRTFSRVNRRHDTFGIKGISSHASMRLTIMIDVSGSVSTELLQKFFAEIDRMSQFFKTTIVLFDAAVTTDPVVYRQGDWKDFKIVGRGGTCFDAPLDYIEKHGLVGKVNIILTDGCAGVPKKRSYPVVWCIFGKSIPYNEENNEELWGEKIIIDTI